MDPSFPATPNGGSDIPSITPDGRFVSFDPDATHLIPGGTQHSDVYRRQLCPNAQPNCTESTTLISVNSAGAEGNGRSHNFSISASGRLVLTITGSGFLPGALVQWNGSPRDSIYVKATTLEVFIPSPDTASAVSSQITVVNPVPGSGSGSRSRSIEIDSASKRSNPSGPSATILATSRA